MRLSVVDGVFRSARERRGLRSYPVFHKSSRLSFMLPGMKTCIMHKLHADAARCSIISGKSGSLCRQSAACAAAGRADTGISDAGNTAAAGLTTDSSANENHAPDPGIQEYEYHDEKTA